MFHSDLEASQKYYSVTFEKSWVEVVYLFVSFVDKNLLEKPTEREFKTDNSLAMVQCKVLKQLQLLEGRKIEDQDLVDDIQFLNETLQSSVQDLRWVVQSM